MITPDKARELLRVPQPHLLEEALETVITLGERVNAQAEQLARVRAVIAEFQRIELTVSSNRDLLAALDGAK